MNEMTWEEYLASRDPNGMGEHRDSMGVPTFKVRVLTFADIKRLMESR